MVNTEQILDTMHSSFSWICENFASYLSTMGEIIVNTFENFPSFGFDSKNFGKILPKSMRPGYEYVHKNFHDMILAISCAFVLLLTLKLLWSCLCCICCRRRKQNRYTSREIQVREAGRWIRQAELDHQAAQNDMRSPNGGEPAYEWVCFKCQQSAEKAIKAALISESHNNSDYMKAGHDLFLLCAPLKDDQMMSLASNLQSVIGVTSRTRYPDLLPYPRVPRDVYTEHEAIQAWEITAQILQHVQDTYEMED